MTATATRDTNRDASRADGNPTHTGAASTESNSTESRRRDQLYAVVDNLTAVHNEWADDANRPNPDEMYWDAVDAVINAFATGSIPAECRTLCECVSDLARELAIFDERIDFEEGYPHNGFWESRQRLEDARKLIVAPIIKPLESMQELHRQGVSNDQIARIYKLFDQHGEPQGWLVQKELDNPGSVLGKDWKDPRLVEAERAERESIERAQSNLAAKSRAAQANARPCPETPLELWEQSVSVEQAALMLRQPVGAVQEMFDGFDRDAGEGGASVGDDGAGPSADDAKPSGRKPAKKEKATSASKTAQAATTTTPARVELPQGKGPNVTDGKAMSYEVDDSGDVVAVDPLGEDDDDDDDFDEMDELDAKIIELAAAGLPAKAIAKSLAMDVEHVESVMESRG